MRTEIYGIEHYLSSPLRQKPTCEYDAESAPSTTQPLYVEIWAAHGCVCVCVCVCVNIAVFYGHDVVLCGDEHRRFRVIHFIYF
jgi:hypothetical protein